MARLISKAKPTPLSRRLVRKLRAAGIELPDHGDFALLGFNPGWGQRSAGACSFSLLWRKGAAEAWTWLSILGADPASLLVRRNVAIRTYVSGADLILCGDEVSR